MSFELNKLLSKRFYYEAGATQVYDVPRGNLFSGMNLNINLLVDIVSNTSSNAPDFQVARAIQKIEIFMDQTSVWSLSGEALAAKFLYRRGAQATSNIAVAGSVATSVPGKMFLKCPFSPEDAARGQDYAMDTRGHVYQIAITWRNLTTAGTLFGTISGTIAAAQGNNYIDLTLEKLNLRPGPDGKPDSLANITPFMRGLRETITDVTSNQVNFPIDISKFKQYRGLMLLATHDTNSNQTQGNNSVLSGKIQLKDTQEHVYHNMNASDLREETSLDWGIGSSLPAGIYDIPLTRFGNVVDEIVSNQTIELSLLLDVTKQTNATKVRAIFDTTERQ